MGIGLYLEGHCKGDDVPAPKALLTRVEAWAVKHAGPALIARETGKGHEGRSSLFLKLHPGAEAVEVAALGKGRLLVSAKTSSVGPGYHGYLCDLLKRLGKSLHVTWDQPEEGDEGTRYFHTGDRAALERDFLQWLKSCAEIALQNVGPDHGWYMSMSTVHEYECGGQAVTPMGYRDADWFKAVVADPSAGTDIFPWWEEGQGAQYALNRALCLMWSEVRWRPPINDSEISLYESVFELLQKAYAADPDLDYPWREWREMAGHFQAVGGRKPSDPEVEAAVARRAAKVRSKGLVGYRRRPVKVHLPGRWSVTIPGPFAEAWEDEGRTWSAWDSVCSIWITPYTFLKEDGTPLSAEETLAKLRGDRAGERFDYQSGKMLGRAFLEYVQKDEEDEGETSFWRLCGRSAAPGYLAGFTICWTDPAYKQWAIGTWQSIQHA